MDDLLKGRRVLVVEDEALLTMFLGDVLTRLGCVVADTAGQLERAAEMSRDADFDIAILDVDLNGRRSFPIAELLVARRKPFIFVTGYGEASIPDSLGGAPVLLKPFQVEELAAALQSALAGSAP